MCDLIMQSCTVFILFVGYVCRKEELGPRIDCDNNSAVSLLESEQTEVVTVCHV